MSTTNLPGSSRLDDRYRLVERLGAGGMSVVWRGFDQVLGRQVAVKVLSPAASADPSFRRLLRAEAKASARLSHPHITSVYDYGEARTADGELVPYVVMELVDGESLAAVLSWSQRLPWEAVVQIASEVSAALAAAHARGIVHRDVTPANVMLTAAGAKVVDFGISALIGANDIDPGGALLGTPAYLAPERLEGGQVSAATDVYAVGLLIYRMLIGQLPWDAETTTALLRAHQYTEPDPLPYVEGLPPAVAALIARCLQKHPGDRPSSAELAHMLHGIAAAAPAGHGFVPDRADAGEDTTILPSSLPDTGEIHQARQGRSAAGPRYRSIDAPVSPAAGTAVPAAVAEVETAGPASSAPEPASPPPAAVVRPPHSAGNAAPTEPQRIPVVRAGLRGARFGSAQKRRVLLLTGLVGLLGSSAYAWSLAGAEHPVAGPTVIATDGTCVASYAVWSDNGSTFKASVSVANRAASEIADWDLWFLMPGDQVVSIAGKPGLSQAGNDVRFASGKALAPQGTSTMQLSGKYRESNSPPMVFQLDGHTCEAYVSGKPGAPSQPVEHLSDNTTRLGPVPDAAAPIPGLSTAPDGVVVPVPVIPDPTGPGVITSPAPDGSPIVIVLPGGETPPTSVSVGPLHTVPSPPDATGHAPGANEHSLPSGTDDLTTPPTEDPTPTLTETLATPTF